MTATGRLRGKRALITGAGSGIGREVARHFAAEDARVAVLDISADRANTTTADILASGGTARAFVADVSVEDEVAAAFAAAAAEFGGIDTVVVNAAIQLFGQDARVDELDATVWDRTQAVNLRGAFLTCKYAARALMTSGGGAMICTGSPTGLFGTSPEFSAYSASKAGMMGLARVVAAGYAAEGIRCNVVIPGFTQTPLVQDILSDLPQHDRLVAAIPMHRAGRPDDVASAVVFLASDESSFITGAMLTVDGGQTAV